MIVAGIPAHACLPVTANFPSLTSGILSAKDRKVAGARLPAATVGLGALLAGTQAF